jgi:UDP-N-acetylglucosamine transferase subunit ALG13
VKSFRVFVTVGTQLPFDRLIAAVDSWAASHPDASVIAQTGSSSQLRCHHVECVATLTTDKFSEMFSQADVVVAHAGMGSILTAVEIVKPIVVLARLASLDEHRSDHQVATVKKMASLANVYVAHDASEIPSCLGQAMNDLATGPDTDTDKAPPLMNAAMPLVQALRGVIRTATAGNPNITQAGIPK